MKYIIILILLSLNILNGTELELSKIGASEPESKFIEYQDFLQSILNMQPEAYKVELEKDEQQFIEALLKLKSNNIDEAEAILLKTLKSDIDLIQSTSKSYLSGIYLVSDRHREHSILFNNLDLLKKLDDYKLKTTEIVDFKNDSIYIEVLSNLILVPIIIKSKTYNFLFDTGTDKPIIKQSIIDELSSKTFDMSFSVESSSSDELESTSMVEIDEFYFGKNKVMNSDFIVIEDKYLEFSRGLFRSDLDIDGILGWDIIKHFEYIFDTDNELIIINPNYNIEGTNTAFWLAGPFIRLKQEDGYEFNFFFDSGSEFSEVTNVLPQKLELDKVDEIEKDVSTISGKATYNSIVYDELELSISNTLIKFSDIETSNSNNFGYCYYDGVLGADLLSAAKIYFSIKKGTFKVIKIY